MTRLRAAVIGCGAIAHEHLPYLSSSPRVELVAVCDSSEATAFFMRVEVDRVKQTLADLEKMTIADTIPEDFVDLAETSEFNPEIQEGECSA